jgi:phosphatidylinositol alpha-1,6-mannosyltransferase
MYPGVDTQEYRPAPRDMIVRRRFGWDDRRVVLTVGRLMKRKGHEHIIRALPRITETVPNALYAIVGDGEERRYLEQLVNELQLNSRVVFHGELPNDDVRRAYQQCDLFALPNCEIDGEAEGFGIVLLEAQSCGKPVIAGDSGGTVEAVNTPHSGRIIRHNHANELVETIRELLRDDAQREQMGQVGRNWVVNNFDLEVMAQQAEAMFSGAMACQGTMSAPS